MEGFMKTDMQHYIDEYKGILLLHIEGIVKEEEATRIKLDLLYTIIQQMKEWVSRDENKE